MPSTLKSHYWAAVFCTAAVALTSAAFADDAFGPMAVPAAAQPFKLGPLQLIALHDAQFVMHNDGKTFGSDADVATVGTLLKASNLPDDPDFAQAVCAARRALAERIVARASEGRTSIGTSAVTDISLLPVALPSSPDVRHQ